jgi:anti-anti-sigma factor
MGNGTGLERATHRIMDIAITQTDNGYTLVALRGELRREASQMLEEKLHPLIAEKGSAMVIDLTGMPTVDSSGLSQLIGLATHARLSESRVVLFGPTAFVAGLFELTRLNTWFDIAADEAGAVAMLRTTKAQ